MVPDFLEEEKEGKIDPWQDDDRVRQTSGDHAVLALVEEQGKPEVGDDVEGGGEETEEESVEKVADVEEPDNLNSIAASNFEIQIQIQTKIQIQV